MSFRQPNLLTGKKAGADLTGKMHKAVKMDTNGDIVLAGAGEGLGFLMNENTLGGFTEVSVVGGGALGIAAAAIAPAAELKADANGDLVVAASGDLVIAIAMESAAIGDHFEVMPVLKLKA